MSAQPSLLELFETQRAASSGQPAEDDPQIAIRNSKSLNPFRKYFGPCVKHSCGDDQTEKPALRLFWCHFCRNLGCWSWLIEHKD